MLKIVASCALVIGCAGPGDSYGVAAEDLNSENGISFNGRSFNGVSLNGMSLNGLDADPATSSSPSWFNSAATTNAIEMQYVVKCAKPSGTTVTWTNPQTGTSYTWQGLLGLAPSWTNRAMTTAEQQVLTACLL